MRSSRPDRSALRDSQVNDGAIVDTEIATVRSILGLDDDTSVEFDDSGWDSRVYLVSGGVAVFKFARNDIAVQQYEHELAALGLLESQGGAEVVVPRVRWVDDDRRWFGYEGIVGPSLVAALPTLSAARRREIGTAIGRFLSELHAMSLPNAPICSIDADIENYANKLALSSPALEAEFNAAERARIESFVLDTLATGLRAQPVRLALAHGDLGPWNVVVGSQGDRDGVGIIDFGDVGYHDPAIDFAGRIDATILDAALDAYDADDALRERAFLRARALPVLDIPFYLGKGDAVGLRTRLDEIRVELLA